MVQAPKDRPRHDAQMCWEPVPVGMQRHGQRRRWLWNTWSQRHMRAAMVIMWSPYCEQPSHMVFRQGDDEVEAFSPQRTEQPLAEGVRLGTLWRRFQDPESQVLYTLIEIS